MTQLIAITVLVGAALLSSCSSMKGGAGVRVEIDSSPEVIITNVSVVEKEGTVHIRGVLRPNGTMTTRTGHVDLAFITAEGDVRQEDRITPNFKIFSRKSSRSPSFSASANADRVELVRVTHHPDMMGTCEL